MAYYNGFPATYQPMYQPYPYQPVTQSNQPAVQSRMVEVFPAEGEAAVPSFPVNNGGTVMIMDRADAFIAVKSVSLDGTPSITYYDKRPPAPETPPVDMGAYVTREEFEARLSAFAPVTKRASKKEVDNEPV